MHYKEILRLKDIHEKEVNFYSTVDINLKNIIGISITEPNIFDGVYNNYTVHFSKEDTKTIIKAITERLEELEKPEQTRTLIGDEIIRDLEKRIESIESTLSSLSSHLDDKNNDREYIEKMKALAKGYEDMYHRYFNLLYGEK
jgi:hypothetical protein